jgi:hypothetical protein
LVHEYVNSHPPDDPAVQAWINDRDQCDQQAEIVRFFKTDYALPVGKTLDQMPRTRKRDYVPLFLQHKFVVRCPIHGEQEYIKPDGNHISKKSVKKR